MILRNTCSRLGWRRHFRKGRRAAFGVFPTLFAGIDRGLLGRAVINIRAPFSINRQANSGHLMRCAAFGNLGSLRSFLALRHFLVQHCVTPALTALSGHSSGRSTRWCRSLNQPFVALCSTTRLLDVSNADKAAVQAVGSNVRIRISLFNQPYALMLQSSRALRCASGHMQRFSAQKPH